MTTGISLDDIRVAVRGDVALLLAEGDGPGRLRVMDRAGDRAAHLPQEILAPAGPTLADVLAGRLAGRLPRLALMSGAAPGRSRRLGPALVVAAADPVLGDVVLVVARRAPRRPFDDDDMVRVRTLVAPAPFLDQAATTGNGQAPASLRSIQGTRTGAEPAPTLGAVVGGSIFRDAFDMAPTGMSLVDDALRYRWVNAALCTMLGRDREDLCSLSALDVVHPDHVGNALGLYDVLRGGKARAVRGRLRFCRPDGRLVWADLGGSVFTGAAAPRLFLVQQFDVTAEQDLSDEHAYRAMHDDLTGLANRALLRERLQTMLWRRDPSPIVAFYLDIDDFKQINDRHGHAAGDAVLRETGRRLARVVRDGDTVARVGGDEFVVVGEVTGAQEAQRIAQRIGAALKGRIETNGESLPVSISAGVALSHADDGPDDLISRADSALLTVKGRRPRTVAAVPDPA